MAVKKTFNKANYQKNTNMVAKNAPVNTGPVTRVKTDGRIGSVTPPAYLKGGFTVDNNQKAGPPGKLGSKAGGHMSAAHDGQGTHFTPRVMKARKMADGGDKGRPHTNPINWAVKGLRPLKPD